ncbi:MAG: BamA/TamA family outer membrane protein [Prevotella sp.]|nr:BamA/TamA family outer membrane protein [Prevotella sp.]
MRNKFAIVAVAALTLTACSETKYVADGEYLLDRAQVKSDVKASDINTAELKQFVRQRGNARWFSALKIPLYTYNLSGRDTSKWINRTLRSIGEPPVIYDSVQTYLSMKSIQQQLMNKGYLRAGVDVLTMSRKKKLRTVYELHPGPAYHMRNVGYDIQDTAIARLLGMDSIVNRGLEKGMMFNVENLDNERKRITSLLTNQGYFRFNKDFISYRADSVEGTTDIDLTLVLHRFRSSQVADAPHRQYTINRIRYLSGNADDSVIHLRPKVLQNNTYLQEGKLYASSDLQSTYNHFGRLGAVRYTNISLREHPDSALIDCDIAISTNKPSTISFQPEGTNTAGDLGAAASLTYVNRNLFHGSEALSIELRGAFEAIKGLEGYSNSNFLEYSLQTKLQFPRFIAPFLPESFHRSANATSEVSLLYDLQNRPEFLRRVFSVGWRYKWDFPYRRDRYQLDLLDLNFITMPWISEKFRKEYMEDIANRNALLLFNYQDLFIMRTGFRYAYNNGTYAIKTNIETGGNLLSLMANTFGFHKNEDDEYTFLNVAFAQYVKGDFDYSRYFQLDYRNQIVFHIGFGIAYPYGNSDVLPFEKMYFSGGANSVRGWSVRSLGPGNYDNEDGGYNYLMHTGDMKLDVNLEYRAHLFWKLGGALFVDAGNIWNLRDYENQPGGQFRLSDFWKQIAVSYGLGIRFNFDYFILRFDMGMKAVNPVYKTEKEHFPIIHPKLSRDFAFHFAVGLPF